MGAGTTSIFNKKSGSEKGVIWKRGLFRKVHFLEILENLEILEILENPQTVENKERIRHHFLEILENLDFRDSRDSSSEKTPFVMTPFSGPEKTFLESQLMFRFPTIYNNSRVFIQSWR